MDKYAEQKKMKMKESVLYNPIKRSPKAGKTNLW